jgi:endoglucanase
MSLRLASGQTQAPAPLARHSHHEPCGEGVIATQDRRAWFNPQAVPIPALLHDLLTAAGPSGHEEPAAAVWREAAAKFAEVNGDTLGNSFARVTADGAATLAIFGHIDEIGVAVTHIDGDGLLAFTQIGTYEKEILNGQRVVIAGHEGPVEGVVAGGERLHIDVGAVGLEDAAARVAIGDAGVWRGEPVELGNSRIASRALDNRLGAYVALEAARRIAEAGDATVDVVAVASVQEEQQHDGAMAAVYALEPDVALAIDVTYASDVPGGDPARYGKIELGAGATITRGTIINRHVFELLLEAAEEEQIPHAVEVFTRRTGTDADDVHKSRGGVPTGIISIPVRYMHSPGEIAALDDVEAVIALVVAFARRLTPQTSFLR